MYLDTETLLYYDHARYYSPQQGRFISPDPIGVKGGINIYAYALNDAINLSDPTGLNNDDLPYPAVTAGNDPGGDPLSAAGWGTGDPTSNTSCSGDCGNFNARANELEDTGPQETMATEDMTRDYIWWTSDMTRDYIRKVNK